MELIARKPLLMRLDRLEAQGKGIAEAVEAVTNADAIENAPRTVGTWRGRDPLYVDWRTEPFYRDFGCSVCSAAYDAEWNPQKWQYCPKCGAQMCAAIVPGGDQA